MAISASIFLTPFKAIIDSLAYLNLRRQRVCLLVQSLDGVKAASSVFDGSTELEFPSSGANQWIFTGTGGVFYCPVLMSGFYEVSIEADATAGGSASDNLSLSLALQSRDSPVGAWSNLLLATGIRYTTANVEAKIRGRNVFNAAVNQPLELRLVNPSGHALTLSNSRLIIEFKGRAYSYTD